MGAVFAKVYIGSWMTSIHYHKSNAQGFKSPEYAAMFDRLQTLYWSI